MPVRRGRWIVVLEQQEGLDLASFRRGCGRLSVATVLIGPIVLGNWAWGAEGEGAKDASVPVLDSPRTEGPQDAKVESVEVPEVRRAPGVELPKEAELRERVKARWDAVVKGELDRAYGFETPEYRKAHTEQEYREEFGFGRRIRWHVATLKDLRYDDANEVEAIITLDYSFALPSGDQVARTTGDVTEHWVYSDGLWWRRHAQQTLGGKTQSQPSLPQ